MNKKIIKSCKVCNKEFETSEDRIKIGRGKFCSRVCYDYWQKNYKQEICFYICNDCGEAIQVRNDHLKDRTLEYCLSCYSKRNAHIGYEFWRGMKHTEEQKEKMKKEWKKRNTYKGGLPEKYPRDFINIRKDILQRDNFTCQKCGKFSIKNQHIHHKDGDRFNNISNNLVTLCFDCHMNEHWGD